MEGVMILILWLIMFWLFFGIYRRLGHVCTLLSGILVSIKGKESEGKTS
jgi:hypothetical protein